MPVRNSKPVPSRSAGRPRTGWQKLLKILLIIVPLAAGLAMLYESQRMTTSPPWKKYSFDAYSASATGLSGGPIAVVIDSDAGMGTLTFRNDFLQGDGPLDAMRFSLPKGLEVYNVTVETLQRSVPVTGPEENAKIATLTNPATNDVLYNVAFGTVRPDIAEITVAFRGEIIPNGEFVVGNGYRGPRARPTILQINSTRYACDEVCFDTDFPDVHFGYVGGDNATFTLSQDGGLASKLSSSINAVDKNLEFMKNLLFSLGFTLIALGAGVAGGEAVKQV